MKNYGYFRVAAAVPTVRVADTRYNTAEICRLTGEAFDKKVSLVAFPELSLTGYTCGDLFHQEFLVSKAEEGVRHIAEYTRGKEITVVAGAPVRYNGRLYNCAVVIRNGSVKGIVPKTYIPASEARWFASGAELSSHDSLEIRYAGHNCIISPDQLFKIGSRTVAIELGHDLWSPVSPSTYASLAGAQVVVNLSADNETASRNQLRKDVICNTSLKNNCAYIYCSCGFGESTQDLVYAGAAYVYENGAMIAEKERYCTESSMIIADVDTALVDTQRQKNNCFKALTSGVLVQNKYRHITVGAEAETDFEAELARDIEPHPFTKAEGLWQRCEDITAIQVNALAKRLSHIGCKTAIIGISGGLDSTLALLVTVLAFDSLGWSRERVVGVTMPGYGTTSRTKSNAEVLMERLGISSNEISIKAACDQHFADIGHNPDIHDATYENAQARERTQILMDLANQKGGIVIGTGDLSELALGWATYNGDHMSMYGVNGSIPKTLVQALVRWAAENRFDDVKDILLDIIDTPISPELLPADANDQIQQVTEDLVGPYELHDFFLYNMIIYGHSPEKIYFLARKAFAGEYCDSVIKKWLKTFIRRFFNQQFKRSCLPDGPKAGPISLSPRGDWSMPSDAWSTAFLDSIE
jgi:NAD+ synthase (glutamine-hydrolysing)